MRYNPPLAALALALLAAVTVKAQNHDAVSRELQNHDAACTALCKRDTTCFNACGRCHYAIDKDWLAKDAHSAPPTCQSRCGKDKYCLYGCHAYQNSCCTPPFGCCPYDARLCVCKPDSGTTC